MGGCKSLGSKIIPLIHTSAMWDQYPVFSHPEFSQCSLWWVAAVWYLLDGRYSFLPDLPWGSLDHHPWGLQSLMAVTSFVYWYSMKVFISQYLFFFKCNIFPGKLFFTFPNILFTWTKPSLESMSGMETCTFLPVVHWWFVRSILFPQETILEPHN